jgi:hypothetical protein
MKRQALVICCLAGIACGSALLGALAGWRAGQANALRRGDPGYWADEAGARLRARLDLTSAQAAAVAADIDQAAAALRALRADTDRRTRAALAGLADAIDAHLDARQRGEFARMRSEPSGGGLDLLRLPRLPDVGAPAGPAGAPSAPEPGGTAEDGAGTTMVPGLPSAGAVATAIGLPSPEALIAALPAPAFADLLPATLRSSVADRGSSHADDADHPLPEAPPGASTPNPRITP